MAKIVTNGGAEVDVDEPASDVAEKIRREQRALTLHGKSGEVVVYVQHVAFVIDDVK